MERDHPHDDDDDGGVSQGKRDTWGSFVLTGVPWLYLLDSLWIYLGVKRWHLAFLSRSENPKG